MGARYLDKNSHEPLYRQLAKLLVSQIQAGDYQTGHRLPSERELSEVHQVSRITARQAIDLLFEDGMIYREQGRGTFVAEPRMRHLQGLTSFTEDMQARGFVPHSRVLTQEVLEADEELQNSLRISAGQRILHLVRLRMADGRPIALQASYISLALCSGLEDEDFKDQSLFALLRSKYYLYPTWTEIDVQAVPASKEEAVLLEIRPNDPLLVIRGKTFTDSFEPIETVRTTYTGKGLALYIGRQRIGGSR
ncbi:MAG TPA: GntR family transcriptional regulator [Anaerolineales bacterium]|nr:GntR family transcriptional regulator [Anaerolineales bacterium]